MEVFSSSSSTMSDGNGYHCNRFSPHPESSSTTSSSPSYQCDSLFGYHYQYLPETFKHDGDECVPFDFPLQGYRLGPVGCHLNVQQEDNNMQSTHWSELKGNGTPFNYPAMIPALPTCSTIQALLENPWVDLPRIGKITMVPAKNVTEAACNFEISFKDNCVAPHEVKFHSLDRMGYYTLLQGDCVDFKLCVERHLGLLTIRAKQVSIISDYLVASNERRLKGVIYMYVPYKRYGYLLCTDAIGKVLFQADEFIDTKASIYIGQHLEFTPMKDTNAPIYQVSAKRIQPLPFGSIEFGISVGSVYSGIVLRTPTGPYYSETYNNFQTRISKLRRQNQGVEAVISQLAAKELTQEDVQSYYEFAGKPGLILFGTMTKHDTIDFYWNTCVDSKKIINGCNVKLSVMYYPSMDSVIAVNVEVDHVARRGFAGPFPIKSPKIFSWKKWH